MEKNWKDRKRYFLTKGISNRAIAQRAVWRNGGCDSLESTTKQKVTWLVASAGSPTLRQAATTLAASRERHRILKVKINN